MYYRGWDNRKRRGKISRQDQEQHMIAVNNPNTAIHQHRRVPGWSAQYSERLTSAEDAIRSIRSNSCVFMSGMGCVPQVLLRALVDRAPDLDNVELIQVLAIADSSYVAPGMEQHLRVNTL